MDYGFRLLLADGTGHTRTFYGPSLARLGL